jgi:hypothetical protein
MSQEKTSTVSNPHYQLPLVLDSLYRVVDDLETAFPGLHFTPDGHMVGSLGEALAAYYYGVKLNRASEKAHDGHVGTMLVQVKATQGNWQRVIRAPPARALLHPPVEAFGGSRQVPWLRPLVRTGCTKL